MSSEDPARGRTVPVVLASGSPRRLSLLRTLGVEPTVRPADIDESLRERETPAKYVERLAREKASAVVGDAGDALVIAADTTVTIDGDILGKPADRDEARAMLTRLAGRAHQVLTGVCVARGARLLSAVVTTRVCFRPLDDEEIEWFVARDEPYDKAGGYGIQEAGGAFVAEIAGSESNVIGLPLAETVGLARDLDVELLR